MEALRAASIEMLEQVGLPPSPRRRLQHALEVEVELDSPEQGDEPHNSPSIVNWGRLGRMPAGWHQRPTGERSRLVVTRSEPVSHADAAVGDDSPIRAVEAPSINDVTIPTMAMKTMAEEVVMEHLPFHSSGKAGRLSGEKGCCYQCYRKVFLSTAFRLSNEALRPGTPGSRVFCSEGCLESFREVRAAQDQRAAELCKLRESLQGSAEGSMLDLHEHVQCEEQ
eukprot:g23313.t1